MSVAMEPQSIDVNVRIIQFGHLFAGEIGWQAFLPELVFALDFAFGLGCWSIQETNVVEFEGPTELSQRVWGLGEKDAVIINIEL